MQQYFSKKRENDILYLDSCDFHHIKNVMRIKSHDSVIVGYDGILYMCLMNEDLKSVTIKSVYKESDETKVIVYMPVLSDEKMSFIIEKGTEMGVTKFVPVQYERCKFVINKDKVSKKLERYNKIAKEASEQARRTRVTEVSDIIKVDTIDKIDGVNIVCSLDKDNVKRIKEVLNDKTICDTISIAFGPEGGLTSKEESVLVNKGFIKTSLGSNVLRTETVLIAVCSIINYVKGEWVMKNGIDNFIELLVKGDFFLIFLIVMMIVVTCIIAYLIKLQMNDRYSYEEDDEEDEDDNFVEKYIPIDSNTKSSKKVDQKKFDFENNTIESSIKNYESDQEEMAIISADELDNRISNMKETGEFDRHLEQIDEYEAEQENKAIISYEELLKRASTNTVTYESTENLGGIKVGKVDTSKIEIASEENNTPYYKEEAFLNALKEFRGSLQWHFVLRHLVAKLIHMKVN